MSGEVDYMLDFLGPVRAAYDKIYRSIIANAKLMDACSSFAMKKTKYMSKGGAIKRKNGGLTGMTARRNARRK